MDGLTEYLPDGVMSARLAPQRARALNAKAFRGQLDRVLPGVYADPDAASTPEGRLRAIGAYGHDLVVTRHAAAALTWWDDLDLPEVWDLACPRAIAPGYGLTVEQRIVPRHLTTRFSGAVLTAPELTVLDLIPDMDDAVVYEALRRRQTTVAALERALKATPKRRGNKRRREIVADCAAAPWSYLEKEAHSLLRTKSMQGWVANHRIMIGGKTYFIDVAYRREKVAVELDGFRFHFNEDSFYNDRERDAALASAGWLPLRFTDKSIDQMSRVLPAILTQRRRLLGTR